MIMLAMPDEGNFEAVQQNIDSSLSFTLKTFLIRQNVQN